MTKEEIDTITDLLFGNGYDMLKTINDLSNKVKEKDKEIERLNNLKNELINYLNERIEEYNNASKESKLNINKFHYQTLLYDISKIVQGDVK